MATGSSKRLRDAGQAWLKGFAHVAFLDQPAHGVLVLAAIVAVAPWSAAAAAFAATLAVLMGGPVFGQGEWEWKEGVGAYDCILTGLAWGGAFSRGWQMAFLLLLAVLACLALRRPILRRFADFGLPALAVPALVVPWLSIGVFAVLGNDFWRTPVDNPFGPPGAAVAIIVVALGLFLKHARAAAGAVVVAASTAALYYFVGGDPVSIQGAGLWAFTVAPALFALPAVFLDGFRPGWKAGIAAAMLAAAAWLLWRRLPLLDQVPPLMGPLFIGIWCALLLTLGKNRRLCLDPAVQHAARIIAHAKGAGGTLALTGAGLGTASGIPDYTAGQWLEQGVPVSRYAYGAFLADAESRPLYWDACARFRAVAVGAQPNEGHRALAALEAAGHVTATVTQNVDGLHQAAGSRQVDELHGNISVVRCMACDHVVEWPAGKPWQKAALCCEHCGGLLKPAVIAFGENIRLATWQAAAEKAQRCGALLVVGSQLAVSSASALLAAVRVRGVPSIFVTLGPLAQPVFPGDTVIACPAERVLPALALLLDVSPAVGQAS